MNIKLSSGIELNPNELTNEDREAIVKALEETKSGVWKPEKYNRYFRIDGEGEVHSDSWDEYGTDNQRLIIGNIFPTKEAAEKHLTYLKALQVLRGDTKGYEWKFGDDFWSVGYQDDALDATWPTSLTCGEPVKFDTKDDAWASIRSHEKEWRIVLGVE